MWSRRKGLVKKAQRTLCLGLSARKCRVKLTLLLFERGSPSGLVSNLSRTPYASLSCLSPSIYLLDKIVSFLTVPFGSQCEEFLSWRFHSECIEFHVTQCDTLRPAEIFRKTQTVWPMESVISFILNQDITLWSGRKQTSINSASTTQLVLGKLQIQENFAKDSKGSLVDICCRDCPSQMEEFPKSKLNNHYLFYSRW